MKKTLLFLLLVMSLTINADDTVAVVNENSVYCGETVEVDVYLQNQKEIKELEFMVLTAYHFKITGIEGWRRLDNYEVSFNELRTNLYKIKVTPIIDEATITPGNNCILKLKIKIPETRDDVYSFDLFNIVVTYTDGSSGYMNSCTFSMNVIHNTTTNINNAISHNYNIVGYIGGIVFVRSGNNIKKVIKRL